MILKRYRVFCDGCGISKDISARSKGRALENMEEWYEWVGRGRKILCPNCHGLQREMKARW